MKIEDKFVIFENGLRFPRIGLGTFLLSDDQAEETVYQAITKLGVRHIDAAWAYGNEEGVGRGLKRAFKDGIKREDIWITSKLFMH